MTQRIEIPVVDFDHRGSAGWYVLERQVRLVCGDCGKDAGDFRNHSIDKDGTVNASILCPMCGWHVWGVLVQWEHGVKPAGQELLEP